jgi:hypothetical protein
MNAIKKRRDMLAVLLAIGVVAAVGFQWYGIPEAALICGAGASCRWFFSFCNCVDYGMCG